MIAKQLFEEAASKIGETLANSPAKDFEKNAKAVADRYERIYHDLPDPVAYVQDGLFIDANPAFLHTFGVKDRAALDELTLMSFVPHKSERGIKALLKKATEKEVVPSERS